MDLRGRRLVRYCGLQQGEYTVVDEPDLASALRAAAIPDIVLDLHDLFGG